MSRGKLGVLVIAAVVLGIGGILTRAEFSDRAPSVHKGGSGIGAPHSKFMVQQRQAEQKSEEEALQSACAALHKLGGKDENCPTK